MTIPTKGIDGDKLPVFINKSCCAFILLFTKTADYFELFLDNEGLIHTDPEKFYKTTAKLFVDQLEGNECDLFLKSLKHECERRLEKGL